MRVLIGCESSGTVRDAFLAEGHDAMSCDLLPTEVPGPHFEGDVFEAIGLRSWDLAIFHPPCTYLSVSGMHWNGNPKHKRGQDLIDGVSWGHRQTNDSVEFVRRLLFCGIPRIAVENPVGVLSTRLRKPDQVIQPYEYGDPESKKTCLWLVGLKPLTPTNVLPLPEGGRWANQTASGQNKLGPSADRWKIRSKTYPGIARAMAAQFGSSAYTL